MGEVTSHHVSNSVIYAEAVGSEIPNLWYIVDCYERVVSIREQVNEPMRMDGEKIKKSDGYPSFMLFFYNLKVQLFENIPFVEI